MDWQHAKKMASEHDDKGMLLVYHLFVLNHLLCAIGFLSIFIVGR